MTLTHRLALSLALALSLPLSLLGQNGVIVTVAGNGSAGTSGVGGPAVDASVYPGAICVDASNNIYITDNENNRVVKIDASGILTLIAGNGVASSAGDNGPATQASLNGPAGIAVDKDGNLYISEALGNRVRRVDLSSGIITTLAGNGTASYAGDGGPAASASLNQPRGLAVDSGGNLFVADLLNFRVRRVDAVSGIITTVAGTGTNGHSPDGTAALSASIAGPMAVSFDAQGNLLISELLGYDIRGVNNSTGALSTVAGNGGTVFNGDGMPATSAALGYMGGNVALDSGGNLYFADSTGRVRRVDAVTGIITTVAGVGAGAQNQVSSSGGGGGGTPTCPTGLGLNGPATLATLDGAFGVAFTSSSELLIADNLDCLVAGVQLPSPLLYTTTSLSLSGQTLTATVTPIGGSSTPTGTVQFAQDNVFGPPTPLTTQPLTGGVATVGLGGLPAGNYPVIAIYQGDSNYNGSGSASVSVTGGGKPTPSAGANVPYPVTPNTPVTISFNVVGNSGTPTGTVQLLEGSTILANVTLVNGAGAFSYSASTAGKHQITLQYPGDSNYSSFTWTFSVSVLVPSTLTLTADANPADTGATVNLTATLSPATGTGTVSFFDNANFLGTATVGNGTAAFAYSTLLPGAHSLTATYNGDFVVAPAMSNAIAETINTTVTNVAVTTSASTITFAQSLTLTATITPARSTGAVEFYDGTTQLGGATVVNGVAQLVVPQLGAGSNGITAQFTGTSGYAGSTSPAISETVNMATPVVTLTSSANPVLSPASVTFTANMSPSWNGSSLQIMDGGKLLSGGSAPTGVISLTIALSPGVHTITAVCPGDANLNPATSAALNETVQASSTLALSTSASAISFSQPVTLTAALTPSAATGSVQFTDSGASLGSAPIAGGVATLTLTTLAAGSHSIQAVYGGDGVYLAGTSSASALTVSKAATQVNLSASPNPSTTLQSVALTVTLSPSTATGSVQFLDGTTVLGTATVTSGTASLSVAPLSAGGHSITASYLGDSNCNPATSAVTAETVNKASTITTLSASSANITVGQTVTLTASVAPNSATGTVQFLDGATLIGTAALSNGAASFTAAGLAAGTHSITAAYSGDANDNSGTSAAVTVTVAKAASTVTAASSPNPSSFGQTVTLTAAVSPTAATGSVQFLDGGNAIGTASVSGGTATLNTAALAAGGHSITAVYSGDANYNSSTSAALSQTVNKIATAVTLSASSGSISYGQSVTLTAGLTPAAATGSVQFLDGSTVLGAAAVANGAASLVVSNFAVGSQSLTAVYSGDANDNSSTSAAVIVNVAKASASVTVASSLNPSVAGQAVTFTATVNPPAATGTVQFLDGSTSLGTITLSGGTASLSTSSLAAGAQSITAVYSGSAGYNTATSSALTQSVLTATTTAISASKSTISAGQAVTLTAAVAPTGAAGTVQFFDGATQIGAATLSSGSASLSISTLAVGAHALTASYAGSSTYAASLSSAVTVTIVAAMPPSNFTATAASSSQINLAWAASATPGVTYNVYASTTSGFTPASSNRIAASVTATSYSETGLAPSTTMYYLVTAQDSYGESVTSNQAGATTQGGISCHIAYSITTQWNVGFGTAVTIQNTGSAPINGWRLTWTWPGDQQITQSWNANYSQTGQNATLTNATWNGAISAGATVSGIGFNGSYSGSNPSPTAFYVNGALCH